VPLWLEWALLEWRGAGEPRAALQLLRKGRATPGGMQHSMLQQAWLEVSAELGRAPAHPPPVSITTRSAPSSDSGSTRVTPLEDGQAAAITTVATTDVNDGLEAVMAVQGSRVVTTSALL
jgi:hypothetical protein